jgi:hypothetical protein
MGIPLEDSDLIAMEHEALRLRMREPLWADRVQALIDEVRVLRGLNRTQGKQLRDYINNEAGGINSKYQ